MENGTPMRSISRSIAILQLLNSREPLSMIVIATHTGVPYPTAWRIIQTLMFEGLVEREPVSKRYRPTALVQTLSHGFNDDSRLAAAARPHMKALTKSVGWPVSLTSHVGSQMVVRESTHAITSLTYNLYSPGYSLPLLECAAGEVFLAFLPATERNSILNTLRFNSANNNKESLNLWECHNFINEIQRAGYALRGRVQFNKNPGKTSSIAVPVLYRDVPVAALTLIFFVSAMTASQAVKKYLTPLQKVARAIAADLDHRTDEVTSLGDSSTSLALNERALSPF